MNASEFSRALRALHNLDGREFDAIAAEVEDGASITLAGAWLKFRLDPTAYFLRCDDLTAAALWKWVEARLQAPESAAAVLEPREATLAALLRETLEPVLFTYWTSTAGSERETRALGLFKRIKAAIGET